jgi:DNA-binding winged helix-turn-helix (wHTH) protein/Tol biopolymer transport system component
MESEFVNAKVVWFADFKLDLDTGELSKHGEFLRLPPQPTKVLAYLVSRPRRLITRDELHRQLWSDGTFVDFDLGLNFCIRQIRAVLDDNAAQPQFIETVPRRGYRFLAEVQIHNGRGARVPPTIPETSIPEASYESRASRRARHYWLATILMLVAIIGAFFVNGRLRRERNRNRGVSERRVTANPLEAPVDSATISPDGKYLAYSDRTGLYVREINTGAVYPLALPKDFKATVNAWLPGTQQLLLTGNGSSNSGNGRAIWKLSILGGAPERLAEDAGFPVVSPDGARIAFLRKGLVESMGLEIWLMRADGNEPKLLTKADPGDWVGALTWAPNGLRVALVKGKMRPVTAHWALETVSVQDGTIRQVFSDPLMQPILCWGPDGRIFYADALDVDLNDSTVKSIAVDPNTGLATGESQTLSEGLGLVGSIHISADGRRLSVLRNGISPQVFIGEFNPRSNRLRVKGRLTMDDRANNPWAWTPDSKAVLFVSRRNGVWNIFKQEVDRHTAELFVGSSDRAFDPRLSPDGSEFYFLLAPRSGDLTSPIKVMRVPASGGPPHEVLTDIGVADIQCSRLPSNLCILGKPAHNEIAVFSFDDQHGIEREVARVPDDIHWSLSPEGSSLAIAALSGNKGQIRFISLNGGPSREIQLKGEWTGIRGMDWFSDSNAMVIAADNGRGTTSLLYVDLSGNCQQLLEGHLGWAIPSPDRHYLAFTEFTGENNVWMLENF